jgi:hypothetical protein
MIPENVVGMLPRRFAFLICFVLYGLPPQGMGSTPRNARRDLTGATQRHSLMRARPAKSRVCMIEALDDADHVRIAVGYELAVETGEEREHRPVLGEDEASERCESCARRVLGQHAEQLDAEPLPLPSVVYHDRKLGVGWIANRILRHRDDTRSGALLGLGHEGELAWKTRTRDAVQLVGRELVHRGEEAVSPRLG